MAEVVPRSCRHACRDACRHACGDACGHACGDARRHACGDACRRADMLADLAIPGKGLIYVVDREGVPRQATGCALRVKQSLPTRVPKRVGSVDDSWTEGLHSEACRLCQRLVGIKDLRSKTRNPPQRMLLRVLP